MNEADAELLSQLRDIHGAADPGWWPPAPGWWVLGAVALAVVAFLLRLAYRRWLVILRRRRLLDALAAIDRDVDAGKQPHEYLARLNRFFRIVALRAFPATTCARLQGEDWVAFISGQLPRHDAGDSLAALAAGPYQPAPAFDAKGLQAMARLWVQKYG